LFQKVGLAVVSLSIKFIIYASDASITCSQELVSEVFSSIIFHLESSIFLIGVMSFFFPIFAKVEYDIAISSGVISPVPREREGQYWPALRDFPPIIFTKSTMLLCPHAR
jgi:hypothetical protein